MESVTIAEEITIPLISENQKEHFLLDIRRGRGSSVVARLFGQVMRSVSCSCKVR
jgi:hypothetical protein